MSFYAKETKEHPSAPFVVEGYIAMGLFGLTFGAAAIAIKRLKTAKICINR